jgi:hypothetical protein
MLFQEGLRHLIFLDYYLSICIWPTLLILGGAFGVLAYGHNLAKFIYDFRNILRFVPYGPFYFRPTTANVFRFIVSIGLVVRLIKINLLTLR